MSLRNVLHVTRTVRRAQFVGRAAGAAGASGEAGPGAIEGAGIQGIAIATSAMELGPEMAVVMAALVAIGVVGQFVHMQPGGAALVLPEWNRNYSDIVHQNYLERLYGKDVGDKLWTAEFSHRSVEVDLRGKLP